MIQKSDLFLVSLLPFFSSQFPFFDKMKLLSVRIVIRLRLRIKELWKCSLLSEASEQQLKVPECQLSIGWPCDAILTIHLIGNVNLGLLDRLDALFDGLLAQKLVNGDRFGLADAVNAIAALLLQRRIPVDIEQEHSIGADKVQTNATSGQGQEHHSDLHARLVVEACLDFASFLQLHFALDLTILDLKAA